MNIVSLVEKKILLNIDGFKILFSTSRSKNTMMYSRHLTNMSWYRNNKNCSTELKISDSKIGKICNSIPTSSAVDCFTIAWGIRPRTTSQCFSDSNQNHGLELWKRSFSPNLTRKKTSLDKNWFKISRKEKNIAKWSEMSRMRFQI